MLNVGRVLRRELAFVAVAGVEAPAADAVGLVAVLHADGVKNPVFERFHYGSGDVVGVLVFVMEIHAAVATPRVTAVP
jgi:hypothetical protein